MSFENCRHYAGERKGETVQYDILLRNGTVIDPANGVSGVYDVAIADRKIEKIGAGIPASSAKEVFDVSGMTVIPGLVDLHTHISPDTSPYSHRMLAAAGVTAAMDMAGPIEGVLELARDHGAGLTVGSLNALLPGVNIPTKAPTGSQILAALDDALDKGSLGLKVLAGLHLLDPEAIGNAFRIANECRAYIAVHCGSLKNNSNLEGFLEAVELAGENRVHIAHINTYCRGLVKEEMQEAREAIDALTSHPHLRSESYLSPLNGNWATCENGTPKTPVCKNCLRQGGYPETQEGLRQAILDGWARINVPAGGQSVLMTGQEAVDYWLSAGTKAGVSFAVNSPGPRYWLATAKRADGSFVCDALSTDGGGIPRNALISHGLSLIKFGALTWEEFIQKTSVTPARILGLSNHGSLRPGLEANITVIDAVRQKPELAISNGLVIMVHGFLCGKGTRFLTTVRGEKNVRNHGLEPQLVELSETGFYRGL